MNPILGVPNFREVEYGLYRGGQPDDQGWNGLKALAVKRVVKLNTEQEGSDVAATALGMEVCYWPIQLMEQLVYLPDKYAVYQAVNAIVIPGTFVHCEHGQDRTGLIVGCYRVWSEGWAKDSAFNEMLECGFHKGLLGLDLFWDWRVV
jgi:protein tyrosine/serine phosphatase